MKTTGVVLVIIGVLAFIGTTIMGNNVLGPLVWTIVGIFLIIRANHKNAILRSKHNEKIA